jgi:hypothetical protein
MIMDCGKATGETLNRPVGFIGGTKYFKDERYDAIFRSEGFWDLLRWKLRAEGLPYCDENPDSNLLECYIMQIVCRTQLPIDTIRICMGWALQYPGVYKCKKGYLRLLDSVFSTMFNRDKVAFTKFEGMVLNLFESDYKDVVIPEDSIIYLFNEKMANIFSTVNEYAALQPIFKSGVEHYGIKMMALHNIVYHMAIADHKRFGRLFYLLETTGVGSISACLNFPEKIIVTPQKITSHGFEVETAFFELQEDSDIDYIGCLIAALNAVADTLNSSGDKTSYF